MPQTWPDWAGRRSDWIRYANLIAQDYYHPARHPLRTVHRVGSLVFTHWRSSYDGWSQDVIVVRGSDDFVDWLKNFRFLSQLASLYGLEHGDSGTRYHRGFLGDAKQLFAYTKPLAESGIKLVLIGHSRGAAIASIVAASLKLSARLFACPRVVRTPARLPPENVADIVSLCRTDDTVAHVPPACWFGHLGRVIWARPAEAHRGEDHRIHHYQTVLVDTRTRFFCQE